MDFPIPFETHIFEVKCGNCSLFPQLSDFISLECMLLLKPGSSEGFPIIQRHKPRSNALSHPASRFQQLLALAESNPLRVLQRHPVHPDPQT